VAAVQTSDSPLAMRACWLSWIAVHSADQAELVAQLGLTDVRSTTWAHGADLVDEVAHAGEERFSTVVITPAIDGWTLVIGAWCGLPYLTRTALVTSLCQQLSSKYGSAQAYFHSEQNDGEAWLIAEDGAVIRRWIAEYPELALGEPFGVERRLLDAFGIPGKPEDLDPEDDRASSWAATWGHCDAPAVAAESSLDPRQIGPQTQTSGAVLVARTPPFDPLDPITGTAPYGEPPEG
jgi:hypothetical protein